MATSPEFPPTPDGDSLAATVVIGSYPSYVAAQGAVDYLSDRGFPVVHLAIVGRGLRLVETVLGRMTVPRAAGAGALSGAWFGLFIGILLAVFSTGNWFAVALIGVVVGALWGAVFGAVAHAATRGTRDFVSRSNLTADQYDLVCDAEQQDTASRMLSQMVWRQP